MGKFYFLSNLKKLDKDLFFQYFNFQLQTFNKKINFIINKYFYTLKIKL